VSHCQDCQLAIATHKCSICNVPLCGECAKHHGKFWIIDNPDVKMIKLETTDAETNTES
jgi:hypothetical protein